MDYKSNPFKRKALLYTIFEDSNVQCGLCWHQCKIPEGKYGICRTRINIEGTLYCLNYGLVSSFSINPIEKKPLFHYYPGSYATTIGSYSCNFSCPWCQNWTISKIFPSDVKQDDKRFISPEKLVRKTENDPRVKGISVSFNEPILSLEYVLDIFQLCKPETYRMLVTNGYMTKQALKLLTDAGMTGMSITLKGDSKNVKEYCKINVEKVWKTIKRANKKKIHIEIIYLVIPKVNDSMEIIETVSERLIEIDKNIPLHFTRFFPSFQFTDAQPTLISTLEGAHQIAREAGLNYVYIGNVLGHPLENTYCPKCDSLLIKRTGYQIEILFEEKS
ncbi:MAG: AmmeMemoRadiSam system radical SAM enzyme, partial [Candidatus Hodarchaeales archaeon]